VSALGNVACGSADNAEPSSGTTAQTAQAASVFLTLHDAQGARIGEGAGILIAPRVVLTAGHLVAGSAHWTVTSADHKTTVNGTRGLTYDWMPYTHNKSHPRKHDVGVIYLDRPIQLPAYPSIASDVLAGGAAATRVQSSGTSFATVESSFEKLPTFPHAYVTSLGATETLSTGGAVLDDQSRIVAIISGKGLTTGKLYASRLNDIVTWLSPKIACGGKTDVNDGLSIRTYGTPTEKPGCGGGGGSSSGSSGSSGTNGASSSGSSGDGSSGSSGAGSSGSVIGSSGGPDGNCDDGGGGYNSNGSPNGGGGSGGSTTGAGSSGTNGAQGSSGSGGGSSGGSTTGSSGGSSGGAAGSSGTNGAHGGQGEVCSGPNDNPDVCPPDLMGSTNGGGGTPDDTMDYGGCAACGSGDGEVILH
jgi:hypothetical protein